MFSASKTSGPSGYNISNSLRFRGSANASLSRTPASAGNLKTWTWSSWIKIYSLNQSSPQIFNNFSPSPYTNEYVGFTITSTGTLDLYCRDSSATVIGRLVTTQVLRDPSAWYHIVATVDTTQATAANRLKLYVNGSQVTAFSTATYPSQNANLGWNLARQAWISNSGDGNTYDGYQAEINFIDGQALTPSSFGSTNSTTGVWQPAKYTGTYGTNGFYLQFSDIATTSGSNAGLGKDFSGNGNYWNTNNISVTAGTTYDAMKDSPTLTSPTVANYATMNPLKSPVIGTYSNANLTVAFGTNDFTPALTTIYPTSGKWYWEAVFVSGTYARLGVQNTTVASTDFGSDSAGWRWGSNDGQIYNGSLLVTVSTYTTGDVLGFCLDLDNGKLYVAKNGTWQNSADPASGTGAVATNIPTNTPMAPAGSTGYLPTTLTWNFGQRPFSYTPPSGFNPLNTFNLPNSTIVKGNSYMDATTYTGTGATQVVTNAGSMKPDFVWLKIRSASSNHVLINSTTGVTAYLNSNTTGAEQTSSDQFTSFNSNGFTLGANTTGGNTNANGSTYVGWQWQAGQGTTSSNTNGSITSTVSVNTTAGFSVVTWTSPSVVTTAWTVGHGLGVTPAMTITKERGAVSGWTVYHKSLGATKSLNLSSTNATTTSTGLFNNTEPTSSVMTFGGTGGTSYYDTNTTQVTYAWAEIAGFSKFTSYTGNGSADGPFVYCGFRPKFILTKVSSGTTADWYIWDTSRNTYNAADAVLAPNTSAAEATPYYADILSNGFKIRNNYATWNGSGYTYIVAAFAENPFKNALAR